MPNTVGGDLADLTQLATSLKSSGDHVVQIKATLDRAVSSAVWTGPAAQRFKGDWQQFAPVMTKLQHALDEAAREVDRRRDAIDRATS